MIYSLTESAAKRVSIVGTGSPEFNDAADWDEYLIVLRGIFNPLGDSEISKIAFRARKQGARENITRYLATNCALFPKPTQTIKHSTSLPYLR